MTENMNCRRKVTMAMFWIEDTETITAWITVFRPLALAFKQIVVDIKFMSHLEFLS